MNKKLICIIVSIVLCVSVTIAYITINYKQHNEDSNVSEFKTLSIVKESSITDDNQEAEETIIESKTDLESTITASSNTTKQASKTDINKSDNNATKQSNMTTTTKMKNTTQATNGNFKGAIVTDDALHRIEIEFLKLVNEERRNNNCNNLIVNGTLDSYANTRSNEIITKFSHERPNSKDFASIIDKNQYKYYRLGENICFTTHIGKAEFKPGEHIFYSTDEQISQAAYQIFITFKNSPPHYKQIINPDYEDTGIGISYVMTEYGIPYFYVSQLFGSEI